jgi:DNA polymerase III epsilon subunit-like protein
MGIANGRYWVIDVEGSGSTPPEIVELAMIEIADLKFTGQKRHWLVRPKGPIEPSATRIHGITDDDVVGAPAIEDIADQVMEVLEDWPIIGHNVRVELQIISRSIPDWTPRAAIDTLKLARLLRPGLPSYGLEKLGASLGHAEEAARLSESRHHSALYDATLTGLIFVDMMASLTADRGDVLRDANILDPKQGNLL